MLLENSDDLSSQMDRIWYDSFEEGFSNALNDHIELLDYVADGSGGRRAGKGGRAKRRERLSYKRVQGSIDNQRWELSRLGSSGVVFDSEIAEKKDYLFLNDLDYNESAERRMNVSLLVDYPSFLVRYSHLISVGLNLRRCASHGGEGDLESKDESGVGSGADFGVVKDRTSDIARMARNGSSFLKNLKMKESISKMRDRFWELSDTKMGVLLGIGRRGEDSVCGRKEDTQVEEKGLGSLISGSGDDSSYDEIKSKRRELPVYRVKDSLMKLINENIVVILVGETGSGKTTQITQYLHEYGYTRRGIIGCTQPRRVAAVSVAKRVSEEMGVKLGNEVGYSIRFEDLTSRSTVIKYMTDGVLMRESLNDPELDKYSVVIMDEAHERSLNTDVLFGILRGVLSCRRDFRLIVTSATMDSEKLSSFFGNAPVFKIPGRTYPVDIEYLRYFPDDYIEAAAMQCLKIHCSNPVKYQNQGEKSDILIFMTGQDDIEATCYLIAEKLEKLIPDGVEPLLILPIYSQLPSDLQAKIFRPSEHRKVIVATNIAETSLTLDGIKYVIDSGLCKVKVYNPKIGMDSLQITPISRANASQRSGRAGRVSPGVCYRMYTENTYYADLFENNVPEIQRTNLSNVVLLLKTLGSDDVFSFPFIDPPSQSSIVSSLFNLWSLGALDDGGNLTELGAQMSRYPLDPPLSKALITAKDLDCVVEVIVVVSMLSVPSIFFRPKDRIEEAESSREKFSVPESDHLTLLNVFLQWKRNKSSQKWSEKHFIHQKALSRVQDIFFQIYDIYLCNNGCKQTRDESLWRINYSSWENVRKSFCSGFFHNSGKMHGIGQYINLITSAPAYIHPNSSLFYSGVNPDYVMYHEVLITSKEYMNTVSAVEPSWLLLYASCIFKSSIFESSKNTKDENSVSSDKHSKRDVAQNEDSLVGNGNSAKRRKEDDRVRNGAFGGSRSNNNSGTTAETARVAGKRNSSAVKSTNLSNKNTLSFDF
ncbi:Prp16p pre-mRNA splicing factor [Cryptosporidium ryanae]|uniref:Prp16p pre-mRNA splicing factor n=1 Tax=Cryptosporidium ryanae TaxID=515981 RepID=UPI00351A9602|nr:Prp16p pre-mRNA splicing factor [Cryptosporidium ryanae]